jgi:hypothetical protein
MIADREEPDPARCASATPSRSLRDRWMNARLHGGLQLQGIRPAAEGSASRSGGERNCLQRANLLRSGDNFLLLDEPTNDLDVLRALEKTLLSFRRLRGGLPDRWFRDRVATPSSPSRGNFETQEKHRGALRGDEADGSHRITYKKPTRT